MKKTLLNELLTEVNRRKLEEKSKYIQQGTVMHPEASNSKGVFLQLGLNRTRGGHATRTKKELWESYF